jgi:proline racemase
MGKYEISCIDSHVAGEPLRLIVGGPRLKGNTMYEKQLFMQKNFDFIRTATMLEPRGHADMFGAVLTEPVNPEADMGILFINGGCYDNMCGHGSIGVGCIAVDIGLVKVQEPVTDVKIETIAGMITVKVEVKNGKSMAATLEGVPSFLYKRDIILTVFDKKVKIDVAYGGNFFAIVDYKQLGLDHSVKDLDSFIRYGKEIRNQVNATVDIRHPQYEYINWVNDILFTGEPEFEGDTYKSLVFLGEAQIDRSPCGTGTSARMGMLYNKGLLKRNEKFMHQSILGTIFEGSVGPDIKVGGFNAIIPRVKSRGYITGHNTLIIDSEDPVKDGFLLR